MGRIVINTGQVRSLGGALRSSAGVVTGIRHDSMRMRARTTLDPRFDPALRSAGVDARSDRVFARLNELQAGLNRDARTVINIADRMEGVDQGPGRLLLSIPWPRGHSPWRYGAAQPPTPPWLGLIQRPRWQLPLGFGHMRPNIARVGRGVLGGGLGLLREGRRRFNDLRRRAHERIRAFVAEAWNAIWGRVTDLFRQVREGIERLSRNVARVFNTSIETITRVGRQQIDRDLALLIKVARGRDLSASERIYRQLLVLHPLGGPVLDAIALWADIREYGIDHPYVRDRIINVGATSLLSLVHLGSLASAAALLGGTVIPDLYFMGKYDMSFEQVSAASRRGEKWAERAIITFHQMGLHQTMMEVFGNISSGGSVVREDMHLA